MPRKTAAFKRAGLHRLECDDCDGYAYATVAELERVGLPACGCGARYAPARLELALLLGAERAPAVAEYRAELESVARGQAPHCGSSARAAKLRAPEVIALERVESRRRSSARARRLRAIAPAPEPMPF